jgi:glucose/arabinose dehydrogenase
MNWRLRAWWAAAGLALLAACGADPVPEGATEPVNSLRPALKATPYGMDKRPSNPRCVAPVPAPDPYGIAVQRVFPALQFQKPLGLLHSPSGPPRWYVLEKAGVVQVFQDTPDAQTASVALDLRAKTHVKVNAGLLGMAFHPRFAENGFAYVVYTGFGGPTNLRLVLSRFVSRDGGQTFDPASEQVLLRLDKPWEDHNGGHIAFGKDGYLYFGTGDGGSPQDKLNNAQNPNQLFGKMLRLDVDGGTPYGIPPGNPFAKGGGRPEIYALGLRNPWSWSFDRLTGELWLGDVGESSLEEVNKIVLGGNYGWPLKEGTAWFRGSPGTAPPLVDPEYVYPHTDGFAVLGGYVYRGSAIPSLAGKYVFADYSFGRLWFLSKSPASGTN